MRRELRRQLGLLETAAHSRAQLVANWLLLLTTRLTESDGGLWDPCLSECEELDADSRHFETVCLQLIMRLRPAGTDLRKTLLMTQAWAMLRQSARLADRISATALEFSYVTDFQVPVLLTELAQTTGEVLTGAMRTLRDWDENSCRTVLDSARLAHRQCTTLQQHLSEHLRTQSEDLPCGLRLQVLSEWLVLIADMGAGFADDVRRAVATCPASQTTVTFAADDDPVLEDRLIRETPRV
ncbi:MAG: hypothetical protein ACK5KS_20605 [Planctomyces sp.]|jgi:phosphate uptake regulator